MRLCRSGQIAGKLVDKRWLIDEGSLHAFMLEQDARKAAHAAELVSLRREEYRRHQSSATGKAGAPVRRRAWPTARRAAAATAIAGLVITALVVLPRLPLTGRMDTALANTASASAPHAQVAGVVDDLAATIGSYIDSALNFVAGVFDALAPRAQPTAAAAGQSTITPTHPLALSSAGQSSQQNASGSSSRIQPTVSKIRRPRRSPTRPRSPHPPSPSLPLASPSPISTTSPRY